MYDLSLITDTNGVTNLCVVKGGIWNVSGSEILYL